MSGETRKDSVERLDRLAAKVVARLERLVAIVEREVRNTGEEEELGA
jgi:hypothetical protein